MKSKGGYDPKDYFDSRYRNFPDLRASGHRRFDLSYNEAMYQIASTRLKDALVRNKVDLRNSKLLDIGPGSGYFVDKFLGWGVKSLVGVDIAPTSVELLREKYPDQLFMEGDFSDPSVQVDDNFDIITAISVIFHITNETLFTKALEKMCMSLKLGGYLIVVDSFSKPLIPTAKHVRLRSFDSYTPIFNNFEINVIEMTPMYFVMGTSFFPYVIPSILSIPAILNRLIRLDYWLGDHLTNNMNGLKILIARKSIA